MLIAHCLLNPHTRLSGVSVPEISIPEGALYQLPCPEISYLGPRRWEVSREQLDFPGYRRFCENKARVVVEDIECMASAESLDIFIMGVPGSPSCAAEKTTMGYTGGRIVPVKHEHVVGMGLFFEELVKQIGRKGMNIELKDAI